MPIEPVTASYLDDLITNSVRESKRLEFKREPYKTNREGKREFLKDVSALANTEGGAIIIGMEEKDGAAHVIVPVSGLIDPEILRLQSLARDSIEPRLPSLEIEEVSVPTGSVIAVTVDASYAAPHRVSHEGHNKFYGRTSAGVYELDVSELREKFAMEDFGQQFEKFVDGRLERHVRNSFADTFEVGPRIVLHAAPISMTSRSIGVDLKKVGADYPRLGPIRSRSFGDVYNIDGLKIHETGSSGETHATVQVFRNGAIEAANVLKTKETAKGFVIYLGEIDRTIAEFPRLLSSLRSFGVDPQFGITGSILEAQGFRILSKDAAYGAIDNEPISTPIVRLPSVLDRQSQTIHDLMKDIRPLRDALWNAAGHKEAPEKPM